MVIMSKFAETLSGLMLERELNAPALAKILKTDRSNITRYLRGERLPSFGGFVAMVEYFGVSADVLLGLVDYAENKTFLPVCKFGEKLRTVMTETHVTQYQIEKHLGISGSCVYSWLFNKSLPSVENVAKLAAFLDVSVDYLLGRVR